MLDRGEVCAGDRRVDEKKAATAIGEKIGRADADFVREATGFAIGGVPTVGHVRPPIVLIDETLLRFDTIWAAAGTPNAVFRLTPADLIALTRCGCGEGLIALLRSFRISSVPPHVTSDWPMTR